MPFRKLLLIAGLEAILGIIIYGLSFVQYVQSVAGFLKIFGESVFVAGILTGTFELVSRNIVISEFRRARTLMTEQIVKVLMHSKQSDRVLRAVEEQVISQEIVRYDYEYTVHLEEIPEKPDYLKISFITMYRAKNLTTQSVEYEIPQTLTIENYEEFPDSTRIEYVQARLDGQQDFLIDYNGPGEKQGSSIAFSKKVVIPPERELWVEAKVSGVRLADDKEVFFVSAPTLDAEISIHPPPDVDVSVETIHPTAQPEMVRSVALEKRWRIVSVLLPGQGVELIWKRKK